MPPLPRRQYFRVASAVIAAPLAFERSRAETGENLNRERETSHNFQPNVLTDDYEERPGDIPPVDHPVCETDTTEPYKPRFGWRVTSKARGGEQAAYRLLVATSPQLLEFDVVDVWDSGRVSSSRSTGLSSTARPTARVGADRLPGGWGGPRQGGRPVGDGAGRCGTPR
jgi:hypothetical protein